VPRPRWPVLPWRFDNRWSSAKSLPRFFWRFWRLGQSRLSLASRIEQRSRRPTLSVSFGLFSVDDRLSVVRRRGSHPATETRGQNWGAGARDPRPAQARLVASLFSCPFVSFVVHLPLDPSYVVGDQPLTVVSPVYRKKWGMSRQLTRLNGIFASYSPIYFAFLKHSRLFWFILPVLAILRIPQSRDCFKSALCWPSRTRS
jgi:hypothetical protein